MKKLLITATVATVAALFAVSPALANGGLLPYGLGLTITNDVAYAIDAETITAKPTVTADWNNIYVGVMPTVLVNATNVVSLSNVEYEGKRFTDILTLDLQL